MVVCVEINAYAERRNKMDPVKVKHWENEEWLKNELETKSTRQISKEQKVSYKLINAWALQFGLIKRTSETILA